MSEESQVHLIFTDYDKLSLGLSAISISPQSEERQFWPVGCPWAGCKIGRHQNLMTSPHFQKSDSVQMSYWTNQPQICFLQFNKSFMILFETLIP